MTMFKKTLTAVALAVAYSGFAHADINAVGDGQFVPVAYEPTEVDIQQAAPLSCTEARATAWFVRELSRTDGEADPEVAFTACGPTRVAESTVDAD
jgi:hypothetical protein